MYAIRSYYGVNCNADAGRNEDLAATDVEGSFQVVENLVGHLRGALFGADIGQQEIKAVAPHPRRCVVLAKTGEQAVADLFQKLVTLCVTVGVVDLLKMISYNFV